MYRLMIESIIGLNREADMLRLDPCIPAEWSGLTVQYRYKDTVYTIRYLHSEEPNMTNILTVDGIKQPANLILLVDDHLEHAVEMYY
jgi:cellobiose phosphorylase